MTPARFRWGMILVTLGLLLLLRNLDVLSDDFWVDLLVYFPVVLIAIGIEKIFTKSKAQFISYATSGLLLVAALGIAFYGSSDGREDSFFSQTDYRIKFDPDIHTLRVELNLNQTDLTIRDSGDDLVFGEFDRFTRKPKVSHRVEGDIARVTFSNRRTSFLGGAIKIETGDDQDWYIRFSNRVPLELDCSGHNSSIHLNMSTTPLRKLKLDADDASIYLKLGELEPFVKIDIVGEDSSVKLRLPKSVGLRLAGDAYRSYFEKLGLIEQDGVFISADFDSLETTVDLVLDDDISSFSIDMF